MASETDYKTTIKIEADTKDAENGVKREAAAFDGLSKSIDAIKNAAAAVWQSISKLLESIGERLTSLVSQVKKLHSSVSDNAVSKAANEAAAATENLTEKQKELNEAVAEQKPGGDLTAAANEAAAATENLTEKVERSKSTLQDLTQVANSLNLENGAKRGAGAFKSLLTSLLKVRAAISNVMRALGVFFLAWEGLKAAYNGLRRLVELWKEYKTAGERAALASNISKAVQETNRLAEAQRNLNNQLKEQLTLVQRAASLRDLSKSGANTFADEQRNVNRAVELAGVTDPRQRQLLEDRYAREDETRRRAEMGSGLADRISNLRAEANAYATSAGNAGNISRETTEQIDRELEIQRKQAELNASDEDKEATKKRIEALEATRDAALKEQKTFEEEAAYRKEQIKILEQQQKAFEQLGTSAAQVQEAAWRKMDEADAEASRKLSEKLATNEAADRWEREFAKASPSEKIGMLQERESSARNRFNTLQSALDVEMGKSVAERNQARMADLRSGIETAQSEMFAARRQREGLAEEAVAVGSRQSVSIGAGSRLNAMGLGAGSGVQRVQQEMANSLKDLVRLGRDQLSALKDIRNEDAGATFQ